MSKSLTWLTLFVIASAFSWQAQSAQLVWPSHAPINEDLSQKLGTRAYSSDPNNHLDPLQLLIDQAYKDIFLTTLGNDICHRVFLASKIETQRSAEFLARTLGTSRPAAKDIIEGCKKAGDRTLDKISLETTLTDPEDLTELNDSRVHSRPNRNYVFVTNPNKKLPVDSFTDWDNADRETNHTYLIFHDNSKNFYQDLVLRLTHEMYITLDTKKNRRGVERTSKWFENVDVGNGTISPINANFVDNIRIQAALSEPQIFTVLAAMRAMVFEYKVINELVERKIIDASILRELHSGFDLPIYQKYYGRVTQGEIFSREKYKKHAAQLKKDGEACVQQVTKFMGVISPIKFKIMSWEKDFFNENEDGGFASTIKNILSFPKEIIMTPIDHIDTAWLNFNKRGSREDKLIDEIRQLIENSESETLFSNSSIIENAAFAEYEDKILTHFLDILRQATVLVRLPAFTIKYTGSPETLSNLCVYMAMPKLGATNIPLSGGPRPSGRPGG